MTSTHTARIAPAMGAAAMTTAQAAADAALKALASYDWGVDRKTLNPIDEAIIATQGDTAARKKLERGLVDALAGGLSRSAQDYVCRKLRVVGTTHCVKALADLLPDETTSHIARYALERMPNKAAVRALRKALPKVSPKLKPGLVGSLGVRRDAKSIKAIAALLNDSDLQVAQAAAHALALIGTAATGQALNAFMKKAPARMKIPTADACLICAEQLLADGKKSDAVNLYQDLKGADQPKHIKVAAMKGLLVAATK